MNLFAPLKLQDDLSGEIYKESYVMKNRITHLFLLLSLIVGAAAVAVRAASANELSIPFDFTVNGKLMKAGNYEVRFGVSSANPGAFLLRSTDGGKTVVVGNGLSKASPRDRKEVQAIFEKSENGYRLAEIQSPRTSIELLKSNRSFGKVAKVEINAK
jgi:hypothetical protein